MTICLVAKCWSDNCIVSVSDRRLSYNDLVEATDDATLKAFMLSQQWGIMFSANDISTVSGIVEDARSRLRGTDQTKKREFTLGEVKHAVLGAYNTAAHERIVALHLSRLNFQSISQFTDFGLHKLGADEFGKLLEKISTFDLGVTFLVYGFDDNPERGGHIFEIQHPGSIIDHDMEGFGIIGSGTWLALGALSFRGGTALATVNEAIYRLCEAKFSAESASGVGRATTVMVFGANGKMRQLPPPDIEKLRVTWNTTRNKPIPDEVISIIGGRFNKLIESDDE